ncbi:SHOCT domain-containing protein [Streptomyces litmocidini]|uniref:SHOCT domain-containing protein n=1 Tax=Streptomyces litmocidini TaxID=67318 RepID=A0ABW7UJX0_9ACTN|nr:SHOCT domain-containing protein [Streptomyces sp. PanSC19]ROQ35240.1 putative oligomerization/nucleic acid binding protein [Streptomyces sp. PanSC19]
MDTQMYLAYDYPLLSMFWTMLWLFLWVLWFILLFRIIADIFRDDSMGGWGKAGWMAFVILLPFLGVLVYVIARGKSMGRREIDHAREKQQAFDAYVRETAGSGGSRPSRAEELRRLADLRTQGDISEEEFQQAKALVLNDDRPSTAAGATTAPR